MFGAIGDFLTDNGSNLLTLAGSIATGNVVGGIAAVSSMLTEATGETEPSKQLASLAAKDSATLLKLEEIVKRDEADLRMHHRETMRMQLEDQQHEHSTTQATIQSGDNATDEYVRRTRPKMARESWWATILYCVCAELLGAYDIGEGANVYIAGVLSSPALTYMGVRTMDKFKGKK